MNSKIDETIARLRKYIKPSLSLDAQDDLEEILNRLEEQEKEIQRLKDENMKILFHQQNTNYIYGIR